MQSSKRVRNAESSQAQYTQAYVLAKDKKPDQALPLFLELVRLNRGGLTRKLRRQAHQKALMCLSITHDWVGLSELARQAIQLYPDVGWGYRYEGEALFRQGSVQEAIASLEKAIELEPDSTEARLVLEVARRNSEPRRARVRPWPARQRVFAKPRELIEQYLLRGQPGAPFITRESVFMTLGSCFAENLALRLRGAGYAVNSEQIGAEINSTFANRYLLEWAEHGPNNPVTGRMEEFFGPDMRQRLRRYFEESDVFVMTLGLAPCFFEPAGGFVFYPANTEMGRALLHADHVMRTTTVAENVDNLEYVIASLRRMAKRPPTIVLTVSPVALTGTSELHSAVVADCVSKSTLRVACHEIMTLHKSPDLIYWPSFEIVRWLGTHFGPDQPHVYGAEDGDTRHVSAWVVELIMGLFLERYVLDGAGSEGAPISAPELASAAEGLGAL